MLRGPPVWISQRACPTKRQPYLVAIDGAAAGVSAWALGTQSGQSARDLPAAELPAQYLTQGFRAAEPSGIERSAGRRK